MTRYPGTGPQHQQGFGLLELMMVAAILGIIAVLAVPKLFDPGPVTLSAQAAAATDLVRRGQSLAASRGVWTRVTVSAAGTNGVVTLETCTPAAASCAEHSRFVATHDITVGALSTPIHFNTLGQPVLANGNAASADASIALSVSYIDTAVAVPPGTLPTLTTKVVSVNVAALTGRVSLGS